jgi:murein DD-endopeptidase MepM/ murein hydrolase activator NlpD
MAIGGAGTLAACCVASFLSSEAASAATSDTSRVPKVWTPPVNPIADPAGLRLVKVIPVAGWFEDSWLAPRINGEGNVHWGCDLIADEGTPIRAAHDGTVGYLTDPKSASFAISGNGMTVEHSPGDRTFYGHMVRYADGMQAGAKVKAGDVIGFVGHTGTTVNHCHFEVRVGGMRVDPYPILMSLKSSVTPVTAPTPPVTGPTPAPTPPPDTSTPPPVTPAAFRTLNVGALGEDVKTLQAKLIAAGAQPGPIDGWFGQVTQGAVKAYQKTNGLWADGVVGPKTGRKLGLTA